ncbi:MAG: radical SAM protein [Gemmatimonadetes bacterium]|nr:MAG: radical SAM protein [Gemmatimonadota bacterium]
MRITFIRPNLADMRSTDAMPPLAFAVLAGATPPDCELTLQDERLAPISLDSPTDLVAITVETYTARRAYQIASDFQARHVPVVMGGFHPTFLPQEADAHADAVVIGDAETVWPQIVQDARHGKLQPIYRQRNGSPTVQYHCDRSIFAKKRYVPVHPVQFGRGCKFNCEFCSIHVFYGHPHRHRPVADIVREIEQLDRRHIFFVDDNLFYHPQQTETFLQALIPLHLRWTGQISIDIARHSRLMDLLAKSGCIMALIGFESLNPHNLTQMHKAWNRPQDYSRAIREFYERDIMLYGTFVLGYDEDSLDTFDRILDFALEQHFFLANFNPLTPMPGTALYARLKREHRLIYDRWWLHPDFRYGNAVFHPRGMTAEQLAAGCYRLRQEFNRYSSMFRRAYAAPHRNLDRMGLFLAANLISRREIHKKQGLPLGGTA